MEANEAPEKIYIHEASAPELTEKLPYHIEYTRTDAFIEKACEWLKENTYFYVNDYTGSLNEENLIEDFRKAMRGE